MGFTTGFTGGITLTLGLAYLTVVTHERNRQAQAAHLRSQSRVLTSLLEPAPVPPPQSRTELAREERSTIVEAAKDRWNEEVENAVRWVQRTDWAEVREGMEGAVAKLLGTGLQKSREGIEEVEKQASPKVQEAVDRTKAAATNGADKAASEIDKAAAATIAGLNKAGSEAKNTASKISDAVKAKTDSAVASTKHKADEASIKAAEYEGAARAKADSVSANARSGAHEVADSLRNSGGTVDAVRGVIRDTISTGIEKGKDAIGKAQAVIGLAEEKIESKAQTSALSHSSAVDKALKERYEKPDVLIKSVEDALADRYLPVDSRDNTKLRGV